MCYYTDIISSQPNNEVVPDSNPVPPSSPAPEFILEVPPDDDLIYPNQNDDIPLPEPNSNQEVFSLQSVPSESDLLSYSLNYKSDIIDCENDPLPVQVRHGLFENIKSGNFHSN